MTSRNPSRGRGPQRVRRQAATGSDPRAAAAAIVAAVAGEGETLAAALDAAELPAEPRDAALARAIARATLRRRGDIDWILDALMDRPLPKKAAAVHTVLRVSAAQLLFMRQADHAAVNVAVDLLKGDANTAGFSGLANAVLRRLIRERESLLAAVPVYMNTPEWLWDRWCTAWGTEAAEKLAAIHREEPQLDLAFASPEVARPEGAVPLAAGGARVAPGSVPDMDGFSDGGWWVQDAAAQLPVTLFGDLAGKRVLDMCAAPGGKALQLAARGARVTALEIDPARADRLAQNVARTRFGDDVEIVVGDAAKIEGQWDAVLLDAPCSATGTLRRQPDVAWSKRPADLVHLARLQRDLIRRAAACVAPGGSLVFATCSIEPEEGEGHLGFVAALPGLALVPVDGGPAQAYATADGAMRTLPFMPAGAEAVGLDGFFAARFDRR